MSTPAVTSVDAPTVDSGYDEFTGFSPVASFMVQSIDQSAWGDSNKVGAILGFTVFAIAYIITTIWIFYDISKTSA